MIYCLSLFSVSGVKQIDGPTRHTVSNYTLHCTTGKPLIDQKTSDKLCASLCAHKRVQNEVQSSFTDKQVVNLHACFRE